MNKRLKVEKVDCEALAVNATQMDREMQILGLHSSCVRAGDEASAREVRRDAAQNARAKGWRKHG